MKTRNALVSNSSSASFICYWRCLNTVDDEPMTKTEALKRFTECWKDGEMDEKSMGGILDRYTVETAMPGTYCTKMIISMMNSIEDCPTVMAHLVAGLVGHNEDGYELVDFRIEGE